MCTSVINFSFHYRKYKLNFLNRMEELITQKHNNEISFDQNRKQSLLIFPSKVRITITLFNFIVV